MPVALPSSVGFYADANKRILAHTALVQGTGTASAFHGVYVKLPAAANAGPVVCVTELNFFEPNYFGYAKGTDPTTVTGSTPVLYDMSGKVIAGLVSGLTLVWSAAAISAGDLVIIADVYGRVKTNDVAANTLVNPVGIAQHAVTAANHLVEVLLDFSPRLVTHG